MTTSFVSPKTPCDQCLQGTVSLLRQGTYHSTRTGIVITSVPMLYCKTCKQYSYDLQLLVEIEQTLPGIQVPFRYLHIDLPS